MNYDPAKDYNRELEYELIRVNQFEEWLAKEPSAITRPWDQHPKVHVFVNQGSVTAPGHIAALLRRLATDLDLDGVDALALSRAAEVLSALQRGNVKEKVRA